MDHSPFNSARPKRESIAEDEDSIRFDSMMYRRTGGGGGGVVSNRSRIPLLPLALRARNRNGNDDNRSAYRTAKDSYLEFLEREMSSLATGVKLEREKKRRLTL